MDRNNSIEALQFFVTHLAGSPTLTPSICPKTVEGTKKVFEFLQKQKARTFYPATVEKEERLT